jgi:hypothetical protein
MRWVVVVCRSRCYREVRMVVPPNADHQGRAETMPAKHEAAVSRVPCMVMLGVLLPKVFVLQRGLLPLCVLTQAHKITVESSGIDAAAIQRIPK